MRKKELRLVVTFASTHQAMKMEQYAKDEKIRGRIIPLPREISAGCGLCYSAPPEARDEVLSVVEKYELTPEQVVEIVI